MSKNRYNIDWLVLPMLGGVGVIGLWTLWSALPGTNLPSPLKTWEVSKLYIVEPFAKRGELDQGILRFTWYSLVLVAKGYVLAILIGTPLGLLLGLSKMLAKSFDPIIQILRPVSPLAWLPLGLVLFQKSEPAALFTIAVCAMWPTVLNTAVGVRAVPQASSDESLNRRATAQGPTWVDVSVTKKSRAMGSIFAEIPGIPSNNAFNWSR